MQGVCLFCYRWRWKSRTVLQYIKQFDIPIPSCSVWKGRFHLSVGMFSKSKQHLTVGNYLNTGVMEDRAETGKTTTCGMLAYPNSWIFFLVSHHRYLIIGLCAWNPAIIVTMQLPAEMLNTSPRGYIRVAWRQKPGVFLLNNNKYRKNGICSVGSLRCVGSCSCSRAAEIGIGSLKGSLKHPFQLPGVGG